MTQENINPEAFGNDNPVNISTETVHQNRLEKFLIDKGILKEAKEEFESQAIGDLSFQEYLTSFENEPGAINHIGIWNETLRVMESKTEEQKKTNLLFWFNLSQEWRIKCKEND